MPSQGQFTLFGLLKEAHSFIIPSRTLCPTQRAGAKMRRSESHFSARLLPDRGQEMTVARH